MKNIAIPILVVLLFLVMGLYLVTYQVRETESAFVTRFGQVVREVTEPGLKWKLPTPIERVHKFDSRMRVLEVFLGETTTASSTPIIVNTYVVWRVAEPMLFLNATDGSIDKAVSFLESQISDTQNRVIGQHPFGEFVNSDPDKIKFDDIQREMLDDVQAPAREYGIEIKMIGIKQLKISENVSEKVFARMRAERQTQTEATKSQGEAQAVKIRTDADAKKGAVLAAALGRAKAIRGQGDAEAAKYYERLEQDPEFSNFLRDLEALQNILGNRTTIVIPADAEPFKLLKEMPKIQPK